MECIVTSLPGVVNNPNLPKLGVIRLQLAANLNASWRSLGNHPHLISFVSGELTLKNSATEETINLPATIPANTNLTWITGNNGAVIEISDKYSIDNLSVFGLSTSIIRTSEFRVYDKPIYYLFACQTRRENIMGDWSDIISGQPVQGVTSIDAGNTPNVAGELKDFAEWAPECVAISLNGSAITGSIEEYIQRLRNTGRTSAASIDFTPGVTFVTFNGQSVSLATPGNITWTENTITYNGVTVNA